MRARSTRCRSAGIRDGRFTSQYSRTFVEAGSGAPMVPRLSAAQDEALDLLARVCEELCFEMTLEPGDVQLAEQPRHVSRPHRVRRRCRERPRPASVPARLSMPNSRALPEGFEVLWGSIEAEPCGAGSTSACRDGSLRSRAKKGLRRLATPPMSARRGVLLGGAARLGDGDG